MSNETFKMPDDPQAAAEIDRILRQQGTPELEPGMVDPVKRFPRYVFSAGSSRRVDGVAVVSNGFEEKNGTIVRKLTDVAYLVRVADAMELVVHEPEEAWV